MVDLHNHYSGELEGLCGLLDQVGKGITTAGQAHSELDQLTLRATEGRQRSLRDVLDRFDVEHNLIGEVLEEIDGALVHLAPNPTDIGPVSDAVDLLTDTPLSHFAYEERELLAPLAQHGFYPGQVTSRS